MKSLLLSCLLCLSAAPAVAQSKSPAADALREMLKGRAKNTIAAIEAMPADKFEYKPTADQMTFGHLAAHIAEANYYFCANNHGQSGLGRWGTSSIQVMPHTRHLQPDHSPDADTFFSIAFVFRTDSRQYCSAASSSMAMSKRSS